MSEKLPPHAPEQHTPKEQPALPPTLQNVKDLLDRDALNILVSAYEELSDTGKTALLKSIAENQEKMGRFLEDPVGMKALVKDIVKGSQKWEKGEVKLEKVEKKEDKVEKKEDKVEKEEEDIQKVWETIHKKTEKKSNYDEELKQAREQLEKTYALFGGKDGFESKFPKHEEWKQEATARVQEKAKQAGKELTPDELATRVETSMIVSHGEDIKAGLPPDKQKDFISHMGELRASADSLDIPYNTSPADIPFSVATEKAVVAELVGFKEGDKVEKTGSEIRYGDQVVDMSKTPPVRSVENGPVRVTLADKDGAKERNYHEQQEYRNREMSLTEQKTELETYINANRASMVEKFQQLPQMKRDHESAMEGSREKEELKGAIEKIEKELEEFKQKTEQLEAIKHVLAALEQEEKIRSERYRESLQTETDVARENLQYVASTRLDVILGDEGIKLLIDEINEHRTNELTKLSLETKWEQGEKKIFADGAKKLMGLQGEEIGQFFEPDGFTMKQYNLDGEPIEKSLKQILEKNGVYGGIPPAVIREEVKRVMSGGKVTI